MTLSYKELHMCSETYGLNSVDIPIPSDSSDVECFLSPTEPLCHSNDPHLSSYRQAATFPLIAKLQSNQGSAVLIVTYISVPSISSFW
jgi:hypothetical protein